MSYIDGQGNAIEDAEACFITYQIVKALEHLHGEKIAHRDIKPENILLDKPFVGARVILTDFGHAFKLTEPIKTRRNRMKTMNVGTSYYVAP